MPRSVWSFPLAAVLLATSATLTTAAPPEGRLDHEVARSASIAASPTRVLGGDFSQGIALALDSDGHRHLVAGNLRGELWYATDRTGSWETQRLLTGREGWFAWAFPSIAMDEEDRVHVAVVKWEWTTPSGTAGIWYLTDAGRSRGDFGTAKRIAGNMMTSPSLRVADGVVNLAYAKCECIPMQPRAPLFFRTDRSGTPVITRIADVAFDPALRMDPDGDAHIVYSDRGGLRYTTVSASTGRVAAPARIPGSIGHAGTPSLALDAAEQALIAWSSGSRGHPVLYGRQTPDGWSAPLRLGHATTVELSVDASDEPHVVLGWDDVVHRWLAGGTWRERRVASDVSALDTAIRAFGEGVTIAWSQDRKPRGVWVIRD